jgi:hypothetical protein
MVSSEFSSAIREKIVSGPENRPFGIANMLEINALDVICRRSAAAEFGALGRGIGSGIGGGIRPC